MSKITPTSPYEARRDAFIRELTKLTKRFGVVIGGCGCCGSPYLNPLPKVGNNAHYTHENGDLSFTNDK